MFLLLYPLLVFSRSQKHRMAVLSSLTIYNLEIVRNCRSSQWFNQLNFEIKFRAMKEIFTFRS